MSELWLSGPVENVHPLLTPAAHAFLQVRDDVAELFKGLSTEQIWARLGRSASIGYHAIHIAGATDRLLTYARGSQLSEEQLAAARNGEKTISGLGAPAILTRVNEAMDAAIAQIRSTDPESLTAQREVGRKLLPSTVLGLISHAAEHAYRHAGQIATLRQVLMT